MHVEKINKGTSMRLLALIYICRNLANKQSGDKKIVLKVHEFHEVCYSKEVYKTMIHNYRFQVTNTDGEF